MKSSKDSSSTADIPLKRLSASSSYSNSIQSYYHYFPSTNAQRVDDSSSSSIPNSPKTSYSNAISTHLLETSNKVPNFNSDNLSKSSTLENIRLDARASNLNFDNQLKESKNDSLLSVQCLVKTRIPTRKYGQYACYMYSNTLDDKQHLALVFGDIKSRSYDLCGPLSKIDEIKRNLQDFNDDHVLHLNTIQGSTLDQLEDAMSIISQNGLGIIIYLHQEGRGIGLLEKLKAYNLQDEGHDTVTANIILNHEADPRTYHVASEILKDLNQTNIQLLTNNPFKISDLEASGIKVTKRIPLLPKHWTMNAHTDSQNGIYSIPSRSRYSQGTHFAD